MGEVGRPEKGVSYGQDSDQLTGRDPIGTDGLQFGMVDRKTRKDKPKFPLSLENILYKGMNDKRLTSRKTSPRMISEQSESEKIEESDKGTFLDENNLENLSEDI